MVHSKKNKKCYSVQLPAYLYQNFGYILYVLYNLDFHYLMSKPFFRHMKQCSWILYFSNLMISGGMKLESPYNVDFYAHSVYTYKCAIPDRAFFPYKYSIL